MKKLILSMAAIAMMLTSCNEKDVAVGPQTTTVNASFGFNQSSAMSSSADNLDKDGPNASPFIGTIIHKKVPCNVYGFEVYARTSGQETVYNAFEIEAPDMENAETSTFELKNIFVGDNEFETLLSMNPIGVAANTCEQFELVDDLMTDLPNCEANINAVFDKSSYTTKSYTVTKTGSAETINLGNFAIVNGGAKIVFNGNEFVGTRFHVRPYVEEPDRSGDGVVNMAVLDPLSSIVELIAGGTKGLVINDNSFTDEATSRQYVITAQKVVESQNSPMSKIGVSYEYIDQTVMFTVKRGYCPNLKVSFDNDFHMIIEVLGSVQISIGDFIVDEPK